MADFNFIVIPELRQCLESDYKELQACLKAEAWKAVHVLAGSIVEAVLIDALSTAGVSQTTLDSMDFASLVALAKDHKILPDEAVELSTVIRKYRNLIHPGRVKRLEKLVDASGGIIAVQVVEIITKQVSKRRQETYGYTAEQLFDRLRGGRSALPLVTYLVSTTPKAELERFLVDLVPDAYLNAISSSDTTPEEDTHILNCYWEVFDASEEDVRRKVTRHLYDIYRTKSEPTVVLCEDHFLRGKDLQYLSEIDREFIKAHLLPRLSSEYLGTRRPNIVGIGEFLTADEADSFLSSLFCAMNENDEGLSRLARNRLIIEYSAMPVDIRAHVRDNIWPWEQYLSLLEQREAKINPDFTITPPSEA